LSDIIATERLYDAEGVQGTAQHSFPVKRWFNSSLLNSSFDYHCLTALEKVCFVAAS